jgi:ATP-dependent Clp protease ATP-binding subunit ClpC
VTSGELAFTAAAKEALNDALGEAMRLGHQQIRPGHLLLAALKQRDGVARRILVAGGATPSDLREAIILRLSAPPQAPSDAPAGLVARLNNVALGDVGSPRVDARLLLAILDRNGPMAAWLRERGVDEPTLRGMLEDA